MHHSIVESFGLPTGDPRFYPSGEVLIWGRFDCKSFQVLTFDTFLKAKSTSEQRSNCDTKNFHV